MFELEIELIVSMSKLVRSIERLIAQICTYCILEC